MFVEGNMTQQYVSVSVMVKAMYRPVAPGEPQLCPDRAAAEGLGLRDDIAAKAGRTDPVLRLLTEMDRKLDAILGHLQRDDLRHDFPHDAMVVRLGGDALHLECREPLLPGDHLELVLLLDEFPLNMASCIAEVERKLPNTPVSGNDKTPFALSYIHLREGDRENIIRHVFQEERKRIRRLKNEEDGE